MRAGPGRRLSAAAPADRVVTRITMSSQTGEWMYRFFAEGESGDFIEIAKL